jgi:hypothetical protein
MLRWASPRALLYPSPASLASDVSPQATLAVHSTPSPPEMSHSPISHSGHLTSDYAARGRGKAGEWASRLFSNITVESSPHRRASDHQRSSFQTGISLAQHSIESCRGLQSPASICCQAPRLLAQCPLGSNLIAVICRGLVSWTFRYQFVHQSAQLQLPNRRKQPASVVVLLMQKA